MAEQLTSISKARAKLPRLSKGAQKRFERYIITHEGQPQSVLLGFRDYETMKAAVELLRRPEVLNDIREGLKELKEGKRISPAAMKQMVGEKRAQKEVAEFAASLLAGAGVSQGAAASATTKISEIVRSALAEKLNVVRSPETVDKAVVAKPSRRIVLEDGAEPAKAATRSAKTKSNS